MAPAMKQMPINMHPKIRNSSMSACFFLMNDQKRMTIGILIMNEGHKLSMNGQAMAFREIVSRSKSDVLLNDTCSGT